MMPVGWFDFVEFCLLYREAYLLINGTLPPQDGRTESLQQRALAAIKSS